MQSIIKVHKIRFASYLIIIILWKQISFSEVRISPSFFQKSQDSYTVNVLPFYYIKDTLPSLHL